MELNDESGKRRKNIQPDALEKGTCYLIIEKGKLVRYKFINVLRYTKKGQKDKNIYVFVSTQLFFGRRTRTLARHLISKLVFADE